MKQWNWENEKVAKIKDAGSSVYKHSFLVVLQNALILVCNMTA